MDMRVVVIEVDGARVPLLLGNVGGEWGVIADLDRVSLRTLLLEAQAAYTDLS